jgi:hypothetical protein
MDVVKVAVAVDGRTGSALWENERAVVADAAVMFFAASPPTRSTALLSAFVQRDVWVQSFGTESDILCKSHIWGVGASRMLVANAKVRAEEGQLREGTGIQR